MVDFYHIHPATAYLFKWLGQPNKFSNLNTYKGHLSIHSHRTHMSIS